MQWLAPQHSHEFALSRVPNNQPCFLSWNRKIKLKNQKNRPSWGPADLATKWFRFLQLVPKWQWSGTPTMPRPGRDDNRINSTVKHKRHSLAGGVHPNLLLYTLNIRTQSNRPTVDALGLILLQLAQLQITLCERFVGIYLYVCLHFIQSILGTWTAFGMMRFKYRWARALKDDSILFTLPVLIYISDSQNSSKWNYRELWHQVESGWWQKFRWSLSWSTGHTNR